MNFEMIKEFYDLGLWNSSDLEQLVDKKILSEEQFKQITGKEQSTSPDRKVVQVGTVARG